MVGRTNTRPDARPARDMATNARTFWWGPGQTFAHPLNEGATWGRACFRRILARQGRTRGRVLRTSNYTEINSSDIKTYRVHAPDMKMGVHVILGEDAFVDVEITYTGSHFSNQSS